jgi:antitoxin PrlF
MDKSFTSRVTSKGQITVPREIRERLGLKRGDQVEFVAGRDKTIVRRARTEENPFARYRGALGGFPAGKKQINAWVRQLRDDGGDSEEK